MAVVIRKSNAYRNSSTPKCLQFTLTKWNSFKFLSIFSFFGKAEKSSHRIGSCTQDKNERSQIGHVGVKRGERNWGVLNKLLPAIRYHEVGDCRNKLKKDERKTLFKQYSTFWSIIWISLLKKNSTIFNHGISRKNKIRLINKTIIQKLKQCICQWW